MYILPKLNFSYDSLEPFMDSETVQIHYEKHHQGYIDKLNDSLKDNPELFEYSVEDLLGNLDKVPENIRQKVVNFGGGHANHNFFWECMRPTGAVFERDWFEPYKEEFVEKAKTLFGSGWVWLVKNGDSVEVLSTQNQDSPYSLKMKPILCIDLWEHAYYLKYQNRRADFIEAWMNIVDWDKAKERI